MLTIKDPSGKPLAKLSRKNALHVFNNIVSMPELQNGIRKIETNDTISIYEVRQDLGPIIAAYILVNRNSPDPNSWDYFLRELVSGALSSAGRNISAIVEFVYILSRQNKREVSREAMDTVANILRILAYNIKRKKCLYHYWM